jgi:RNA polymerase sigma-70 factor (ECF subfamily)
MLRFLDGELESAQTFEIEDGRIVRIRAQRNPDKLARIAQLFSSK